MTMPSLHPHPGHEHGIHVCSTVIILCSASVLNCNIEFNMRQPTKSFLPLFWFIYSLLMASAGFQQLSFEGVGNNHVSFCKHEPIPVGFFDYVESTARLWNG